MKYKVGDIVQVKTPKELYNEDTGTGSPYFFRRIHNVIYPDRRNFYGKKATINIICSYNKNLVYLKGSIFEWDIRCFKYPIEEMFKEFYE